MKLYSLETYLIRRLIQAWILIPLVYWSTRYEVDAPYAFEMGLFVILALGVYTLWVPIRYSHLDIPVLPPATLNFGVALGYVGMEFIDQGYQAIFATMLIMAFSLMVAILFICYVGFKRQFCIRKLTFKEKSLLTCYHVSMVLNIIVLYNSFVV